MLLLRGRAAGRRSGRQSMMRSSGSLPGLAEILRRDSRRAANLAMEPGVVGSRQRTARIVGRTVNVNEQRACARTSTALSRGILRLVREPWALRLRMPVRNALCSTIDGKNCLVDTMTARIIRARPTTSGDDSHGCARAAPRHVGADPSSRPRPGCPRHCSSEYTSLTRSMQSGAKNALAAPGRSRPLSKLTNSACFPYHCC